MGPRRARRRLPVADPRERVAPRVEYTPTPAAPPAAPAASFYPGLGYVQDELRPRVGRVVETAAAGECRSCRAPATVLRKVKQGGLWAALCESCRKKREDDEVEARALELYAQELLAGRRASWKAKHEAAHPPPRPSWLARGVVCARATLATWRSDAHAAIERLGAHVESAADNPVTPVIVFGAFMGGVAGMALGYWLINEIP